jgi:hypothetical protein
MVKIFTASFNSCVGLKSRQSQLKVVGSRMRSLLGFVIAGRRVEVGSGELTQGNYNTPSRTSKPVQARITGVSGGLNSV